MPLRTLYPAKPWKTYLNGRTPHKRGEEPEPEDFARQQFLAPGALRLTPTRSFASPRPLARTHERNETISRLNFPQPPICIYVFMARLRLWGL